MIEATLAGILSFVTIREQVLDALERMFRRGLLCFGHLPVGRTQHRFAEANQTP